MFLVSKSVYGEGWSVTTARANIILSPQLSGAGIMDMYHPSSDQPPEVWC